MKAIKIILALFITVFIYFFTVWCLEYGYSELIVLDVIFLLIVICLFIGSVSDFISEKIQSISN